jgi:Peptidase family M50
MRMNLQDLEEIFQDIFVDPELRGTLLASLLGIVLCLAFAVLVHEAGHAIVGRLAGYRLRLIRVGQGPELFRLHIGLALLGWRRWAGAAFLSAARSRSIAPSRSCDTRSSCCLRAAASQRSFQMSISTPVGLSMASRRRQPEQVTRSSRRALLLDPAAVLLLLAERRTRS